MEYVNELPKYSMIIKTNDGAIHMIGMCPLSRLKFEGQKQLRLLRDAELLSLETYKLYNEAVRNIIHNIKARDKEIYEDQCEEFAELYREDQDVRAAQMKKHRRNPEKYPKPVIISERNYHSEYKKMKAARYKLLEAAISNRRNATVPTFTKDDIKLARGRKHYQSHKERVLAKAKERRDRIRADKEKLKNGQ